MVRGRLAGAWGRSSGLRNGVLAAAVAAALVAGYAFDDTIGSPERAAGFAAALVIGVLVLIRQRQPLALAGAITACLALRPLLPPGGDGVAWGVAAVVAAYTTGADRRRPVAWAGLAASLATGLLVMAHDGTSWDLGGALFYGFYFVGPWLVGRAMLARRLREAQLQERNARLVQEKLEEARRAVQEERERIARELHDVVGHALGVIVLQAGGGRRLVTTEPDVAVRALETIETVSREALGEMRRLVEIMRASDEQLALLPQPSLARLPELFAQVREAGLPVEYEVQGERVPLPPGVELAAYRIAQEALTNALKHAGPASVHVALRYAAGELELEIADDGAGRPAPNGSRAGNGLVGIRERAFVYGGRVDAGPREEGGYAVKVRLPYPVTL